MRTSAINAGFGRALKRARRTRGFTQEDFAEVSGRTYVSSLERGLKSPTLEKVAELAAALDVHPLTLLALTYVRRGENLHALLSRIEREAESLDQD